ncbi:hypothetical protein GKZ68_07085 [Hymenobacter sp. BRD128]|uniref:hypothetical protein n=1 Tax=Hymenobacter sp. BRD128 TaxID=2675878 RepID=UPI0015655539|nr:hypothetical protein [Hymenobacter sp. BRD128]QKG56417.1 hypothetical protein GKZ68_07085 [Hymenobacter sp. BRD128]
MLYLRIVRPACARPWLVWLAFFALALPLQAACAAEWKLETDKDGIQVYSRLQADSRFKEIKVQCEMPGTLEQLVALYSDVANYPHVISNTRSAYLLRTVNETEFFYYLETQMPALVANRDVMMRLQFAYAPPTHVLRITTSAVDGLVPPQPGRVRIPYWSGEWQVWALSATRLRISYCFRVDPGGELPARLVNRLAPVAPYQSFLQLRKSLQLPRYQGHHYAFLTPANT